MMSTDTTIPDDTRKAARSLAMYVYHHAIGSDDDSHSMDTDFATDAIAEAIHDAVMAERERCARLMEDDGEWTFAGDPAAMAVFEDVRELAADAIRAAPKSEG